MKTLEEFLTVDDGNDFGYGNDFGSGDGFGSGSGSGDGFGSGDGSGYSGQKNIRSINGKTICFIDGICCILKIIKGNFAKAGLLNADLTLTPCFIVKNDYYFAHGNTLYQAMESLEEKTNLNLPFEARIDNFIKEFPTLNTKVKGEILFNQHNKLTGSCFLGRQDFVKRHGLSLKDYYTIQEFIDFTKNSYNGEIIESLEKQYKEIERNKKNEQ